MNQTTLIFKFDYGCYPLYEENRGYLELNDLHQLGLSPSLIQRIEDLADWYQGSLHPEYQMLPSLWRQGECNAFNREAQAVYKGISDELPQIHVIDQFQKLTEDPELKEYLLNPRQYYQKKGISGYFVVEPNQI